MRATLFAARPIAAERVCVAAPALVRNEVAATRPGLAARLTEAALGYQRVLAANPHNAQALIGISLVALATGQIDAAIEMATAATSEAPESAAAWLALGQAFKAKSLKSDEIHAKNGLKSAKNHAKNAFLVVLQLDNTHTAAHIGLGELELDAGCPEKAACEYEIALRCQPGSVAAQMGLGHALACMGHNLEALARYEHALLLHPRLAEAEFAAGFVLARLDRPADAETCYRRALAIRPDFAAAWLNLGNLLREQCREAQAEAALQRAAQLRPDLVPAWLNLALLERERRRPDRAESYLHHALELNPNHVEVLVAWCQFRVSERDPTGAKEWLAKALAADPLHAEAVNMRGILLHNEGCFDEAIVAFELAKSLGSRSAVSNRGNSLLELGLDAEALEAHLAAVELDPDSAGTLYNLALTRLRLGDWPRGWPEYEARWRFREVHRKPRTFVQPRWQGEQIEGRRVLLHAEQGLGDTIQFCRYAALVAQHGGRIVLQVQALVVRLLRSLPIVQSGLAEISVLGEPAPDFDLECPLMSLPAVFRSTVESVPWSGAYLAADPDLIESKSWQFPNSGFGPRIGLAWAGNPRYRSDAQRSMNLETLIPLLERVKTKGANWISLQKGEAAGQLNRLPAHLSVADGSGTDRDLAETAALLATLDLVITTDTCIAHLAGAMAKPVWILLPHLADWRWMQRIETTPWYPTARLFRQRSPGNWAEVLERVAAELNSA